MMLGPNPLRFFPVVQSMRLGEGQGCYGGRRGVLVRMGNGSTFVLCLAKIVFPVRPWSQ